MPVSPNVLSGSLNVGKLVTSKLSKNVFVDDGN